LCFTGLNRLLAVAIRYDDTGVSPEVVLVDLSTDQYFYDQNMWQAYHPASIVAYYGSEEAILAGLHLRWYGYDSSTTQHYDDSDEYDDYHEQNLTEESWIELWTPDKKFYYSTVSGFSSIMGFALYSQGIREQHEAEAIQNQLNAFREALDYLNNTPGLVYYVGVDMSALVQSVYVTTLDRFREIISRDGNTDNFSINVEMDIDNIEDYQRSVIEQYFGIDVDEVTGVWRRNVVEYSNLADNMRNVDFFESQPVYYIMLDDQSVLLSFGRDFASYDDSQPTFGVREIYLAFSDNEINFQNDLYSVTRDGYIVDFSIIAASIILALGLLVVLLIATGRKYKVVAGESGDDSVPVTRVHFTALDKPYWDFGLVFVICWTLLIAYFSILITDTLWPHRNITAMNILFAAVTLLAVPPVLLWITSLAKRIKAGQFWKHTLVYAIITKCLFRFLRFCIRAIRSLWSGMRLSLKIAAISFVSFCMMFFVGVIGAVTRGAGTIFVVSLLFIAVIAVLLLLYANRIRRLELGARAANEGDFNTPIDAGGGELGSIANSINNITAGINIAVEERLKSERLKTELITNVSHDIRTPLTSIITYTDLLDREGLDCVKAPEYLDVLKQKSQRLKTLTDELFEAAKAATGNIDVNLTDLNVGSLINQVLGELDSTIKTSGLDMRVNLAENLYARADGRLMQRTMENLLSNVINYSLPGSRVYLDAYLSEDSYARIDIKNISATELNFDPSELTERFKRGDNSRTDGGSGLGLSIVQSFITAQNGRFDISIDGDLFKATVTLHTPLTSPVPNED